MTEYVATLAAKLDYSLDDSGALMYIEGTIIEPGTYQGIDGKKISYSDTVLTDGAPSAKGRPIIYRHTETDGEEKDLVVGYTAILNEEDGKIDYKGIIYDERVFPFLEDGTFDAVSPEIDVDGRYDSEQELYVAEKVEFTSLTLTSNEHKGIDSASIAGHGAIHISLEKKKKKKKKEKKKVMTTKKYDDAFNDIPEEDRLTLARKFLEDKGFNLVEKKPDDDEDEEEEEEEEETVVDNPELKELKDQMALQASELAFFQDRELNNLVEEIKKTDDEFVIDDVTLPGEAFLEKKAKLEKFHKTLQRALPKIRLELSGEAPTTITAKNEELKKVALEMYGDEETARKFAPQLFPAPVKETD